MEKGFRSSTDAKMYTEFRKRYPNMKKDVIGYHHFLWDEIIVSLKDGQHGIYNRVLKEFRFPDEFERRLIRGIMGR